MPARALAHGHPKAKLFDTRRTFVHRSLADQAALGITAVPGTDLARSVVGVPMTNGERAIGAVLLEDHARDNAFGPAQVQLLETIVSSRGVALENVRLHEETQEALKQQTRR